MILNRNYSLFGARILALLVVLVTSTVVVKSVTTFPTAEAVTYRYSLAPGGSMGATVIGIDRPILLMGCNTTVGNRGIGHVTIQRAFTAPQFLMWVGLESAAGAAITSGFSGALGTHIVYLDFAHTVDIEVLSPAAIRVFNGSGANQTGQITMIW
jgi:hypothetical protein